MIPLTDHLWIADGELTYKASTSQGPGGQNVNRTRSRIQLSWNVAESPSLSEDVRAVLLRRLATRLDSHGILTVTASTERSQLQNQREALERLKGIVSAALAPRKIRRPTAPTKGSKARRLKGKKHLGALKANRRRPPPNGD
jgi:ribosome-associated protein